MTRLDRDATRDQIGGLLGHPPPDRLVEQVFDMSRGNPYFSELLVRRGDLDADELPTDVPDELGQALLDSWRGLSSSGRKITRVLAVGGRPAEPAVLASVGAGLGVSDSRALHEAIEAGVVVRAREGVWFRHPLLADVLLESYLPGEAAPVHAAWAANLATRTAEGVDRLRHLGDLATHQEQAGADSAAFATLLGAADVARVLRAFREWAELLTRAADLWDAGAPQPR